MKPVAGLSKRAAVKHALRLFGAGDPAAAQGRQSGRLVPFLLRSSISAALLYFTFRHSNWKLAATGLQNIDMVWLGAGAFTLLVQLLLGALRWSRIAQACAVELPVAIAVRYSLIAGFFGQVLPSTVGADGIRIWLLGRSAGNWMKATYCVVIDRVAGCLGVAFMVVFCLPAIFLRVHDTAGRIGFSVLGIGCAVALGGTPLLAILPRGWLGRVPGARHVLAMADLLRDFFKFSHANLAVGIYSVVVHVLSGLAVWCLAQGLSAPLSLVDALILTSPVMLITMVPVSVAGWGVRESAMVAVLRYGGVPDETGFLISVLFGLSLLFIGLLGGGLWIANSAKARG